MNATSSNDDLTAREIYCRAVEEPDPEKRLQLVQSLCDGRPDVLQRVQRLLDARQQSDTGLLARVSDAWQAARSDAAKEFSGGGPSLDSSETAASRQNSPRFVGQQFGPYNLLEVLGEGGMGTVYRAKQLVPMEREVALKVIKSESHAPESHARESFARESYAQGAIARFAQERQSMALMQHPNIASVFDGGETDDGRHYLVMELVRGVPVDRYCEENDLPLEQRLALFMELARAIQHAHSKDIIHRDLKPSNVLVTLVDGKPMVKVIDFGIAKSIALQLEIDAERTRTGQLLGTPLYQAPEQLDASGSIADVRCDVYALGVILYKLLTGTTPVDRNVVAQTGYDGLMRKLTEQEYDAPSARAQALVEAEETRPAQGFLDSPIARQSELDWIVLNALHPEPNDRYSSVARLLDDLESFARREPISVGPPRPIGKRSRFSRKSVVLAALLVFGLAAATYVSVASLSNPGLEPDRQGLVPPGPAPAPREIERPGDGRPEPSSASSIALWRETAQLQLALTAFREANYSAIPESFVTRTESSRNDPAASAAYERFDLRRLLQDAAVPQCTLQIEGTADVQAAAFSAQSQRLVVASKTGQIRLYSVNDGGLTRAPKIIGTHPGRVDAIAISPDGSRAATGTNVLWIWDLDRGEILHKGPGYDAGVEAITWSPDGQSIAVGSRYAFAWVGDSSGNELFNIPNNHRHEDILFAPDSGSVLVPTREGIDQYEIPSGKRLRTIAVSPLEVIRTMTFFGDKQQYLVAAERFEENALVIDFKSGKSLGMLQLNGQYPRCLRTTGDGWSLAAMYPDRRCAIMRLFVSEAGTVDLRGTSVFQCSTPRLLEDDDRLELIWTKSSKQFLTLGGGDASQVWDWERIMPVQVKNPPMQLWDIAPGAEDTLVFFPNDSSNIGDRAFYVGISQPHAPPNGDRLSNVAGVFSRVSRTQKIASLGDEVVEIIDLKAGGKIVARISSSASVGRQMVSLSRDGRTVAVCDSKRISAWSTDDDWKTWRRHQFEGITPDVMLYVEDGGTTLCTNEGTAVREIDVQTAELIHEYDDQRPGAAWQVEIDERLGRVIIGKRETLSVLDRASGALLHVFETDSQVTAMLTLADPSHLLTGHRDGTIRAWHLATMQPLGILFQPRTNIGRISRLEVFPDSNRILAVSRKGSQTSPVIIGN